MLDTYFVIEYFRSLSKDIKRHKLKKQREKQTNSALDIEVKDAKLLHFKDGRLMHRKLKK